MATKTEYEVDESINAYVKDEETLKQMQADGQLKPFSNYFTPDEDENLSCLRTELLWTNPSPNDAYAGGTITLPSTNYDYYDIEYKYYINSTYINTSLFMRTSTLNAVLTSGNTSGTGALVFKREIWKNGNTVTIDVAYSARGASAGVTDNNCLVPIRIYGVLKEPAMIYTGAEIHEGNGIKINNGVISTYDIIYDMKSSDSNVNFGFTSGVKNTALVTTKFNDYHYLDVVVVLYPNGSTNTGGWSRVFRMDLTSNPVGSDWLIAGYCCAYSDASAAGYVNKVTWNLVLLYNPSGNGIHCRCSFNGTSYTGNNNVYISKIYGVR